MTQGAATSTTVAKAGRDEVVPKDWVLLKYGEIALRGRNRGYYEALLRKNMRIAVRGLGPLSIRRRGGVLAVSAGERTPALIGPLRDLLGVSLLHRAVCLPKTPEAAAAAAIELLAAKRGESFAIRCRRRDKRFPMNSPELAAYVGRAVQDVLPLRVDLDQPDLEVHLEVDKQEIFAYSERIPGRGGLPVGSSGRALVLFSGGIDSPVAAFYAMKRGLRCDFVHFSGRPFTGPESIYKCYGLVRQLDRFQGGSRLFVVPFGHQQKALATAGAGRLQIVAHRRLMVRVACALGRREQLEALVTGDCLGQVSSQTLRNLSVVEEASDLPMLRPLIGFDKQEVIGVARQLGTLETSNLPAEDCCTLFSSRLAETRAEIGAVRRLEGRLDLAEAVEQLLDSTTLVRPASGDQHAA